MLRDLTVGNIVTGYCFISALYACAIARCMPAESLSLASLYACDISVWYWMLPFIAFSKFNFIMAARSWTLEPFSLHAMLADIHSSKLRRNSEFATAATSTHELPSLILSCKLFF